jgi:hypothetical protein
VRQVRRNNLASYEPVEKHPNGGKVLFNRSLGNLALQVLDVGGDDGLDLGEYRQTPGARTSPGKQLPPAYSGCECSR